MRNFVQWVRSGRKTRLARPERGFAQHKAWTLQDILDCNEQTARSILSWADEVVATCIQSGELNRSFADDATTQGVIGHFEGLAKLGKEDQARFAEALNGYVRHRDEFIRSAVFTYHSADETQGTPERIEVTVDWAIRSLA